MPKTSAPRGSTNLRSRLARDVVPSRGVSVEGDGGRRVGRPRSRDDEVPHERADECVVGRAVIAQLLGRDAL